MASVKLLSTKAGIPYIQWGIHQGETAVMSMVYSKAGALVNLTPYTAAMDIRHLMEDTVAILELTNGSGITLGGVLGTIVVTLTATQTAALAMGTPAAVFDLDLTSAGVVETILSGVIYVYPEVTR